MAILHKIPKFQAGKTLFFPSFLMLFFNSRLTYFRDGNFPSLAHADTGVVGAMSHFVDRLFAIWFLVFKKCGTWHKSGKCGTLLLFNSLPWKIPIVSHFHRVNHRYKKIYFFFGQLCWISTGQSSHEFHFSGKCLVSPLKSYQIHQLKHQGWPRTRCAKPCAHGAVAERTQRDLRLIPSHPVFFKVSEVP